MALEQELATFQKRLPELLANEGKFVLIQGDEVAGTWETYQDALQTGYERFGLKPFLVKRVLGVENVQYFTRNIAVCH